MSALVIDFAAASAARRGHNARREPAAQSATVAALLRHPALSHDFHFWNGASGMRYVHTVYSLIECPEVPDANVVLVSRRANGVREAIHVARIETGVPSLNLATIRQTAAQLGANEVHVHLLAGNSQHRRLIELDLLGTHLNTGDRVAS